MRYSLKLGNITSDADILYVTVHTQDTERVEIRCPVGPQRLLAIQRLHNGHRQMVFGNLLELACRDCRAAITKEKGKKPTLVLHRYNVIGELVETEVVWD